MARRRRAPRAGGATQGLIHAPSLDHATTAAVLRSGWSAFGTAEAGSPLTVDLSSGRMRAARSLIEGVRSGQELGRLLGGRFERRLHDRGLDRHIDDIRAAVLSGSGQAGRPPTRIVDGLLVARAYTDGDRAHRRREATCRTSSSRSLRHWPTLLRAVQDTVADLDAVSDVLVGQAVHSLLRGDAGVAAPTLAATGSGDSGLPAIDFPATIRGGRLVTVRVTRRARPRGDEPVWPGAAASVPAAAEPRLERWVGQLLGAAADVVVEVRAGGGPSRIDLAALGLGALDAVYRVDALGGRLLAAAGGSAPRPRSSPGGPPAFGDDQLALGRVRDAGAGAVRARCSAGIRRARRPPTSPSSRTAAPISRDLPARVAARLASARRARR